MVAGRTVGAALRTAPPTRVAPPRIRDGRPLGVAGVAQVRQRRLQLVPVGVFAQWSEAQHAGEGPGEAKGAVLRCASAETTQRVSASAMRAASSRPCRPPGCGTARNGRSPQPDRRSPPMAADPPWWHSAAAAAAAAAAAGDSGAASLTWSRGSDPTRHPAALRLSVGVIWVGSASRGLIRW